MTIPLSEFADRLNEIIPVIMKEFSQRQANELFKGAITLPQFVILNFLGRQGRSKMTDIAHFMNVTTAAMTGVVSRLVKSGYVRRTYDSRDRRIIFIKLTPKGTGLVKRVDCQRRQMIIDIFGRISGEERENYLNILTHIRDILTEQKQK